MLNDIKSKIPYQNYLQITALLKNINLNTKEKLNLIFNIMKNSSPETLLKYEPLVLYFNNIETETSVNFYVLMQQTETLENFILDNFVDYNQKELILADKINSQNCFSYVYRILYEAGIDNTNYDNLFELIAHLYMQYEYSNNSNKENIVLELKGIILAISQLQQNADISIEATDIDFNNINSILACA